MKKHGITALFLVFVLLCGLMPAAAFADEEAQAPAEYYIDSADALYSIADDPYGTYYLTEDIDMAGREWMPLEFYGILDGQGHNIFNLTVTELSELEMLTFDGNMKRYTHTRFAGLFSYALNAEIKNLNLLGVSIDITSDGPCYCAAIAGMAEFTTIDNCSVYSSVWLHAGGMSCGVAGLVGFGNVIMSNNKVDTELVYIDEVEQGKKPEQFLGGLMANGVSDMLNNEVNVQGFVSTHGFVHSGGMVGMAFRMQWKYYRRTIQGNTVNGMITFYEQNYNRRAYCKAIIAEDMYRLETITDNETSGFVRNEFFTYDKLLLPEMCENPAYTETVVERTCSNFGYTVRTCTECGYTRNYNYLPAMHIAGDEPVRTTEPTYDAEGTDSAMCIFCGIVLEEYPVDKLIKTENCVISEESALLTHNGQLQLSAEITPENAENTGYSWSSTNESVAIVDENGLVSAVGEGEAEIICSSDDGFTSAKCSITIEYTFGEKVSIFFDNIARSIKGIFGK